jgi:hypothetical protein
MKNFSINTTNHFSSKMTIILILLISLIFSISSPVISLSEMADKLYLALAKNFTPEINKYIFLYSPEYYKAKSQEKSVKTQKIQSTLSDSSENSMEIRFNDAGEPTKLIVKVKDKDKKINITIFNLLGKKVSDVFDDSPGANETEIDSFIDKINKLSNGIYICVLTGQNYRLMKKFTISR